MSEQAPERWKDIPGFPGYQASDRGNFRSLDRVTSSGRRCKGQPLSTRPSNRGYILVDLRDAAGRKVTRSAHTVVLEAHDKPCPPGMEARHLDDDPRNNRFAPGTEDESRARGGNLFWGTKAQNRLDRARNSPPAAPKPRPQRECARCSRPFEGNGRRCHPCVVDTGRSAAVMLSRGQTLAEAMKTLDYPSAEGLHLLAVKYGGYGARKSWWSRTVKPKAATLRSRLPGRRMSRTVSKPGRRLRPSDESPAEGRKSEAGFRPKLGHSGHTVSQNVTQSKTPERDRTYPYPADLTQRDRTRRPPGGTGRSR